MVLAKEKGICLMARLTLVLLLLVPAAARADSLVLILNGIPPTPEHEAQFGEWTDKTRTALVENFGFPEDAVVVLPRPNAEDIRNAFQGFAGRVGADDVFYLFLIGHGSYDGRDYKFNIVREDLTASDYSDLLSSLGAGRSVVINPTISSGASIEALRGPDRVVVTATRTGTERNDTTFYTHFLDALANPASDEDLNERLSVWEAFRYAAMSVARSYQERNLLATEHPQISDNGGEPTGADPEEIPALAQLTHFNTATDLDVEDPVLRALLEERSQLEAAIAGLRVDRGFLPEAEYERRLEDLLVELALKNREIRAREGDR
jgi:hypothetical protein